MTKPAETLPDRLRTARELAEISARRLDELAGLAVGHTSLIEAGRRSSPTLKTIAAIARALGVSLAWLSDGTGSAPTKRAVMAAVALAGKAA